MFFKNKKLQLANKQKLKQVQVGAYKILADEKHPIEEYLNAHKFYSRNLARIAKLMERKYPRFSIVDVGANIGDTIALLRSAGVNQLVYSIEGDPLYFEIMKLNLPQFKNAEIFLALLGEENKTEQLYINKSEGTGKVATSSSHIQIEKLDDIAIKHQFEGIKLLKTDTDGFDLKIIRGSFEIIKAQQPVLFFEYDAVFLEEQNENGVDIFLQLKLLGYNKALFYDNYGKLLLSLTIDNTATILQLYSYMKKREGAFEYFDVCVFHEKDDELSIQVLNEEMKFFN
jgi:FkbM family methyltransferase